MKYLGLLRQNGFPEKGKSMAMQRKIAQYAQTEKQITAAEATLETTTSERKKQSLTSEITELKASLITLDAEICALVENYVKNQDKYQAVGKKMAAGRQSKNSKTPAEPPAPDPAPQPDPPPPPPPKQEPLRPEPPKKTEEKKSNTSTWLFAGLAIIGAVIGINIWQSRN